MATRDDSLAILEATGPALRRLTGDLDNDALDFRSAPNAWSIREVLAHLVDDEAFIMRQRLARIVKEDRPELAPHDEKGWYASRNTARDARDELLADFQAQRAASLGVARLLSPADWQRVGFQPEYGEFTAEGWLERWADHDTVHLNQIEQTLFAYHNSNSTSNNRHQPTDVTYVMKGMTAMEALLVTLGVTGFLALVDLAAMRWGKDSRESGDVPEWVHHHSPKSI